MQRRLMIGAAAAFSAATVGARGHATAEGSQAPASQQSLSGQIKLDRRNAQLRLVQVVFRHGARTPLTDASYLWEGQEWNVGGPAYKAVPLQLFDVNGGPAGPNEHDQKQVFTKLAGGTSKGELTKLGQLQALELGYWLRQQYIDTYGFLPASLKPGVVAARTTNFSRTRATLAGVLTGLYPGVMQPIPVTTSGDLDEILYADTKRCPHLKVLMQASEAMLKASWESPSRAQGIKQLQQQLTQLLNLPEGAWDKRWMMSDVHDAFTSLAAHGKALPHGLTEEMKEAVDRLATEEISAFICPALVDEHGHAVLRLSMGRLLDILLANMETAAAAAAGQAGSSSSSSHAKLMMFSGHDSTIMPLLTALGCDLQRWPPYISNLVFELWELKPPTHQLQNNMAAGNAAAASSSSSSEAPGPFVVRVLYNKQPLQLPGAAEANPTLLELGTFKHEVLAPFILSEEQHAQACSMPISHDSSLPHPERDEAANGKPQEEFSMASGGAGQQQQQQQQQQGELQPPPGTQALSQWQRQQQQQQQQRQPQGKL
ncbi:hypothetical protein OEZ86_004015 [Tetradesmus obliquus]|nr:hypothetical protein OEZ86_004015 [Tetradesmus obliquus]